ncbi:MAG: glycosyltransferase family 39 protein [Deltaproteobacteria bacterium]|nr:glycosyltransferase family 39 protein [Deltaproteobacteria bacterium]
MRTGLTVTTPTARRARAALPALALLALLGLWYRLLAPATVNGDGIGYLKQVTSSGLSPGHPLYVPLLRLAAKPWAGRPPLGLAGPLQGLSVVAALLALGLFFDLARRRVGSGRALFATFLLGGTHAFSRAAQELEVYAPATLCCVATLWALARASDDRRPRLFAALAALFAALAALLHLTLVLLAPAVLLTLVRAAPPGRRLARALFVVGIGTLAFLAPLAWLLHRHGVADLPGAAAWLRGADHGIPYPLTLAAPLIAGWGLAKSLLFVPYVYEASLLRVGLLTAAAVAAWGVLLWRASRSPRPEAPPLDRVLSLAWVVPLAAFGTLFYPSDTERWLFLLPVLILWLARAASPVAWGVAVAVTVANLVLGWPAAFDRRDLDRAARVDAAVRTGDLVVSPGHGWDELIGLSRRAPPTRVALIHLVGDARRLAPALVTLRARITDVARSGGAIYVARLDDRSDPRGFKELSWAGLPPDGFARFFAAWRPRPTGIPGLSQLDPTRLPSPHAP